jgi:hypothetical protein
LAITGITAEQVGPGLDVIVIGIVPVGTSLEQVWEGTVDIIAEADNDKVGGIAFSNSMPYTVTAELYAVSNGYDWSRWTGSGTYDVYLSLYNYSAVAFYRRQNVSFTNATTTVSATTFSLLETPNGNDGPNTGGPGTPETPNTPLGAPSNVSAEPQSASSIAVSWDAVTGATSYKVYRNGYYIASSAETSYTDTGLYSNSTYSYSVSTVNNYGEGAQSNAAYAIINVPYTPYSVNAAAQSTNSIHVSWFDTTPPSATSYNVYRSDSYDGAYALAGSSTETSYTDTGLDPSATYYYKISAVNGYAESPLSSWVSATTKDAPKEGVYIGLISFAGDASDLTSGGTLVYLDQNGNGRYNLLSRLNSYYSISSQSGTALFYAVHKALANLKSGEAGYPAQLESVNVVTFTDGLDNGSNGRSAVSPIEGQTFDSDDDYTAYLSQEIANRHIAGKNVTAYSVGVMGDDVTDTAKFADNLAKIASAGKSQSLTDFGNLQTTFETIADSLQITTITNTTFTMKTTLLASGTKVRMTFDTTSDGASSSKYIEGTITRTGTGTDLVYTLNNITYAGGLGSNEEAGPITGILTGSELNFAFTGVTGYDPVADETKAKQWLWSSGATAWQINSEYNVSGATDSRIDTRSSIIYLVLDSSTSLNYTQIQQIRSAAIQFINSLHNKIYGTNYTGNW